jgi:putative addiction module component (TIGR02574 family)
MMTAKLEKEIATLTPAQKRRLIDELWQQLETGKGTDDFIEPALLKELERRADKYDSNPSGGMSLEDFEKKLLRKK